MSRRMDSSLLFICGSVFFVMLGVGIITPILPLYAETFGVSYSVVGMVVSSFGLARLFMDIPAGSLTDRWGRKPLILVGISVFGVAALVAAFAGNIYHLILSRFVQGIGAALLTTTAMALVGDIAPASERGRYMSYYQGSFFLGTAVGPAIGGLLAQIGGFQAPFFALATLSPVAAIFAYIKILESVPGVRESKTQLAQWSSLKQILSNRNFLILGYSATAMFVFSHGIRSTGIPLYGERVARLSPPEIGIILSVVAFSSVIALTWSGSMIDRLGPKPLLAGGFLVAAVSTYAFILSTHLYTMYTVAAVLGLAGAMMNPAQASAVIEEADPKHRGLSVGVYRVFGDIGIISGPLIVGAVSDQYGLSAPFIAISLFCVLSGAMVYFGLEGKHESSRQLLTR